MPKTQDNTYFDETTALAIEEFQKELARHLPDIYTEFAFRTDVTENAKEYYSGIILDIIKTSFRFSMDFKNFCMNWLKISPAKLPNFAYYHFEDYVSSFEKIGGGKLILETIVNEMEFQETGGRFLT